MPSAPAVASEPRGAPKIVAFHPPAGGERVRSIELSEVGKTFPTKDGPVVALSEIDLVIEQGEFVTVVGSSGCGKSTLLRLVAGLLPASEGEVRVKGRRVSGPDPEIGIVFQ